MNNLAKKMHSLKLRKNRIRSTVNGTSTRPRLSVSISNLHVSAQVIDDSAQKTLAATTSVGQKEATGTMTAKAEWV
jgi:large subunit ribosomal protein L18